MVHVHGHARIEILNEGLDQDMVLPKISVVSKWELLITAVHRLGYTRSTTKYTHYVLQHIRHPTGQATSTRGGGEGVQEVEGAHSGQDGNGPK